MSIRRLYLEQIAREDCECFIRGDTHIASGCTMAVRLPKSPPLTCPPTSPPELVPPCRIPPFRYFRNQFESFLLLTRPKKVIF